MNSDVMALSAIGLNAIQIIVIAAAWRHWSRKRARARAISRAKINRRADWVNELLRGREEYGFYNHLVPQLLNNDRYNLKKF